MLDEKSLELLNAEIDGVLAPADRADLSRRLLESQELRTVRDQLHQACAELDRLPQATPPAGLREEILSALPPAATGSAGAAQSRHGFTMTPRALRYAAAVVGGVLVSAIAFQVARGPHGSDVEQMAGTMARAQGAVQDARVFRIDASQVRGTFTVMPATGGIDVRFERDATQPADAVAPDEVEVIALRGQAQTRLVQVAASQQGDGLAYVADLPGPLAPGEMLGVRVVAAGLPVFEVRWQAPAAR